VAGTTKRSSGVPFPRPRGFSANLYTSVDEPRRDRNRAEPQRPARWDLEWAGAPHHSFVGRLSAWLRQTLMAAGPAPPSFNGESSPGPAAPPWRPGGPGSPVGGPATAGDPPPEEFRASTFLRDPGRAPHPEPTAGTETWGGGKIGETVLQETVQSSTNEARAPIHGPRTALTCSTGRGRRPGRRPFQTAGGNRSVKAGGSAKPPQLQRPR